MMTNKTSNRKVKKKTKQPRVRRAIVGLCLVIGLGALLVVAWADTHPQPGPSILQTQNPTSAAQPMAEDKTVPQTLPAAESSSLTTSQSRHPAAFYSQGIRGGLFSEPQPPAPKAVTPPPPPAPEVVTPPDPGPSLVPVTPVDPFADWSYDGLATMGDQRMALLENTKTKEGQYVQTGDSFLSSQVENITDQSVALRASGKLYTISRSDTITVVPLDKSAPYLSENGGSQPQPGNPQGATPQMSQAPTSPAGTANITADQLAAMRQFRRQFRGMGRGQGMGGGPNRQQMSLPTGP